jgi:hypothetical protein
MTRPQSNQRPKTCRFGESCHPQSLSREDYGHCWGRGIYSSKPLGVASLWVYPLLTNNRFLVWENLDSMGLLEAWLS